MASHTTFLLSAPKKTAERMSDDALEQNARLLEGVLDDFNVKGEITAVRTGPVVTMYELEPAPGIKASRVIGLADDIARNMSAISARVSSIPGRTVMGIELPNADRQMVSFKEMVASETFAAHKGLLPINSLWLWGAGALPPRIAADFDGVWSNHPLATGLARAAGVPTHPVPVDAAAFLTHAAPGTHQLVELDDLADPVQHENGEAYRNAIANLERRWFAPLRQALAAARIAPLRIEAATAYATLTWESGRRDTWKFWRRPRPLIDIARKLADSP